MNTDPSINEKDRLFSELAGQFASRITQLPDKPEESLDAVISSLWLYVSGIPVSVVRARTMPLPVLTRDQKEKLVGLLEKRATGFPTAHLTGRQNFMGLEFMCGPQALIPRKETELLCNAALRIILRNPLLNKKHPTLLDICTGSGNLACSLACLVPEIVVYASDISPEAIALANNNSRLHLLGERFQSFVGDLFQPFESDEFYHNFDIIVCNPPYITSSKINSLPIEIIGHEPRKAFDAGPLGLSVLSRLFTEAPRFLAHSGSLAFEIGLGQGRFLKQRLLKNGAFKNIEDVIDDHGNVRAITAQLSERA